MTKLSTLLVLNGLLALTSAASAQTFTFAPVATYSAGTNSHPLDIAVADVNGDGKPDLLTANGGNATVGRLLGNGNGTFQAATIYAMGASSQPTRLAVADVNGDGRLDLLTANYNNTVGILLNTTVLANRTTLPSTSATLHPNPTSTSSTLTLAGLPAAVAQVQATLLDATGRVVGQQQVAASQGTARAEVPTAGLAAGLYVLRLTAHDAQGQPIGSLLTQRLSVQ